MIHFFFSWYSGSVWGNLLASVIVAIPAYLWGRFHAKRIHGKVTEIHDHLNDDKPFKIGDNDG